MLPNPLFLNVHMYGIMLAVGILCCFIVLFLYTKKMNVEQKFADFLFYDGLISIILGIGSASLFQSVYSYIENPQSGFRFGVGLTFIGGLIGGAACFMSIYFIMRRRYNTTLTDVLSIIPCCITIAHGFGRIGCFFAGCCYGKPTDSMLGVKFPDLSEKVHPTQLYEAAFLFILFATMSYLVLKRNFKYNMSVYLISYGIFRFMLEFIRGDYRGELLGILSPSQFWSCLIFAFGIALIFITKYISRRKEEKNALSDAENA